jgi:hypothetical protein
VLDIVLDLIIHVFIVKENYPNILEKVFYVLFYFIFHFFLDGKYYVVPSGTVVTGILDMRPGVYFIFIFIINFIFIYLYFIIYLYIFIYSFLTLGQQL